MNAAGGGFSAHILASFPVSFAPTSQTRRTPKPPASAGCSRLGHLIARLRFPGLTGGLIALALGASTPAAAFPPAPYYTLHGMVRDQVGQTVEVDGAVILLLKDDVEVARAPVVTGLRADQNYELNIRLDMARAGTLLYDSSAFATNAVYSLAVLMNGQRFYPIEVNGTLRAGGGGERVPLDLNLGVDSDDDGLPDVWEEWQLYQAGHLPDSQGRWAIGLITRAGDLDGDGLLNWQEYIAGTFAGDASETTSLQIKAWAPSGVRLEFYAIAGKFYTIERSTDLVTWSAVAFRPGSPAAPALTLYRATDVGVLSVYTTPANGPREFYRLTVR